MKNTLEKVGKWSFIAGLIIAILIALLPLFNPDLMDSSWWLYVLIILGVIVGFLNIQDKEVTQFLVATLAIMVAGSVIGTVSVTAQTFALTLAIFAASAAFIVSIKAIISLGKH